MRKYNIIFKRIICLVIVISITFLVIDSDIKQAYALPVPTAPWVPIVIEGGKVTAEGATAVATGMSVGGIISVALGIVAVGAGVYLVVDNWETICKAFYNEPKDSDVLIWWNNIAKKALYIYDSNRTLATDIANGKEIKLSNYVLLSGETISIPQYVNDYIKTFIKSYYGYTELTPGTGSDFKNIVMDMFRAYNIRMDSAAPTPDFTFENYHHVIIRYTNPYFEIYASNSLMSMNKVVNYSTGNYRLILQGSDVKVWNYNPGYFSGISSAVLENTYFGVFVSQSNSIQPTYLLLSNRNMELLYDGNISIFPAGTTEYVIPRSVYKWIEPNTGYVENEIKINPQTIEQLKNLDLKNIPDTDQLINNIKSADSTARDNGYEIIDKQIVGENDPVPDDTDPIPPNNPDYTPGQWYDIILNPLKEFARWLFVPDQVVISELVDDVNNKLENQAGLLTYPLTLVIRFLMEVSQLDVTDCILHIPRMEIFGYVLYEGCYYNLTQEIHKSDYAQIYSVYMYFTDFILIIGFISLCIKKGDEMMKGGISPS